MKRFLAASLLLCLALPAHADGFRQKNLTRLSVDATAFSGGSFETKKERDRLTVGCVACADLVAIDVQLGQSTDGTETRYRSGETTLKKMEDICKSNSPSCRMKAAEIGGAVGWVTTYDIGDTKGSTAVLFQDGDLLTIRVLSPNAKSTNDNMAAALKTLATQIVGPKK